MRLLMWICHLFNFFALVCTDCGIAPEQTISIVPVIKIDPPTPTSPTPQKSFFFFFVLCIINGNMTADPLKPDHTQKRRPWVDRYKIKSIPGWIDIKSVPFQHTHTNTHTHTHAHTRTRLIRHPKPAHSSQEYYHGIIKSIITIITKQNDHHQFHPDTDRQTHTHTHTHTHTQWMYYLPLLSI